MSNTYGLCDIVYNYSAVGVPVVHGCERLVALLASGVPDLELDCGGLVESDGLSEESGADGGLPVVVELVLDKCEHVTLLSAKLVALP